MYGSGRSGRLPEEALARSTPSQPVIVPYCAQPVYRAYRKDDSFQLSTHCFGSGWGPLRTGSPGLIGARQRFDVHYGVLVFRLETIRGRT
jgi:hypothetical protein